MPIGDPLLPRLRKVAVEETEIGKGLRRETINKWLRGTHPKCHCVADVDKKGRRSVGDTQPRVANEVLEGF